MSPHRTVLLKFIFDLLQSKFVVVFLREHRLFSDIVLDDREQAFQASLILVVAAVVLLLLLVHDASLHVLLELLDVLAEFDGRLVDQAADDGVDLAVPRSALG